MMRITVTNDDTGRTVHRFIAPADYRTLSGPQLAALLFPDSDADIDAANAFLAHYAKAGDLR